MSDYAELADLPLEISGYRLEPLAQATAAGWTRRTTVVRLRGGGEEGLGEDVTYFEEDQRAFLERGGGLPLAGRTTLDGLSRRLDALEPFAPPPRTPGDRLYRRWAFESAALDLALRQAGRSLAGALGRTPRPVSFVVSLGLGEPPGLEPVERVLARCPAAEFKVDLGEDWTEELVERLARACRVRVVDLKGQYRGAFTGPAPDPARYRWVAELLPDAWLEDPALAGEAGAVLAPHRERITWDANLHSLADLVSLPFEPRCINVKPSRFGLLSELLRVYEYCEARGIRCYGGGQFELGPGRGQVQYLASLFCPDAPNDVAPPVFNELELPEALPDSPLAPAAAASGFGWTPVSRERPGGRSRPEEGQR